MSNPSQPTSGDGVVLVVFVRSPRPGTVKTRLARDLDAEAAAAIYRVLLDRTFQVAATFPRVHLRVDPADALEEFRAVARPGWEVSPQGEGDLGERLNRTLADLGPSARGGVIVIGSDCPELEPDDLVAAAGLLRQHEVVLGPAADGGYYLIGVRPGSRAVPTVFEGIAWSTDQVLAQTEGRLRDCGVGVGRLRVLRDVDTLDDWRAWLRNQPHEHCVSRLPGR